jgi:predicted AAA+ superfamily ATPase
MVKSLGADMPDFTYLDLERPADLRRLDDPELFLESVADRFICLDEIQRKPDLFPVLRGFIDRKNRHTRLLLLGSAGPDLLRQSAESLAGRAIYRELSPFLLTEISGMPNTDRTALWLRGGFPESLLAASQGVSFAWREAFIRAIVERDIPNLGSRVPPETLFRFLRMLAHQHGQVANFSGLGSSIGVSGHTVHQYLDLMAGLFHVRILPSRQANLGKRLVKAPKVYIRDSGILHALWETSEFPDLLAHPSFGASWEGFVIEQVMSAFPQALYSFHRTASGVEIDLVVESGSKIFVVEAKASTAPLPTKGFWNALADLKPDRAFIVAPVAEGWPVREDTEVVNPEGLLCFLGSVLAE